MFIFDVLARRSYFCHRWGKACSFLCIPFNRLFSRGQKKKSGQQSFNVDGNSFVLQEL